MFTDIMNPVLLWFITGAILTLLEFMIPGVLVIFFAFGAYIAALFAWLLPAAGVDFQLVVFLLISVGSLILLRKRLTGVFHGKSSRSSDQEDLDEDFIGKTAVVIQEITPGHAGKVELNGTHWTAESAGICKTGQKVKIIARNSLVLFVASEASHS